MRLLILSNIFSSRANPHGGTFIKSRVSALKASGIYVEAVGVGAIPRRREAFRPDWMTDCTINTSPLQRIQFKLRGRVMQAEIQTAERVAEIVDLSEVDGIMAHGMFSPAAGAIAARLSAETGVPFSVHLHGSDVNTVLRRNPAAFLSVLSKSTVNVFVSKALLLEAQASGYSGHNYEIIPNGIDPNTFLVKAQNKEAADDQGPTFLFVGNLLRIKGADRLPQIFEWILRDSPSAKFVVIGDGTLKGRLEAQTRRLPVMFAGRVDQKTVADSMNSATMLLLPSRSEGWPTVINESYAMGTPVVAADVGGVREAIHDPKFLVSEGSRFEQRFAARAVELVNSVHINALTRRAEAFTWDSIVKRELRALGTQYGA